MTWEEVKAAIENDHLFWLKLFDERQVNEIHLDRKSTRLNSSH